MTTRQEVNDSLSKKAAQLADLSSRTDHNGLIKPAPETTPRPEQEPGKQLSGEELTAAITEKRTELQNLIAAHAIEVAANNRKDA